MGSCSSLIRPSGNPPLAGEDFAYPRFCTVQIKSKDSNRETESLDFCLHDPNSLLCDYLNLEKSEFFISECTLPGSDPRGHLTKQCQDMTLLLKSRKSFMACIFDGHGLDGHRISMFCSVFVQRYFNEEWNEDISDPLQFLKELVEKCESELQSFSGHLDKLNSGATGVFVLYTNSRLFIANIGKNRAVLASRKKYPLRVSRIIDDNEVANINKIHNRRKSSLLKHIFSFQLTQDHAPEDPSELLRIKSSGGKVRRMIDDSGNKIGPHRVWIGEQNTPGLVVSRSFGDQLAKGIGIIAEPSCFVHQIDKVMDLFLIIASDGVWNVMDNEDVINFVESVRFLCSKQVLKDRGDNVNLFNSCAAQLICEEARFRWLTFVEEDDIPIDDISCVIVEFNSTNHHKVKAITIKQKMIKKKEILGIDEDD